MRNRTDYIARARNLGWLELRELWARITDGQTPGWPAGKALEYLVLRAFELDGAEVRWPFTVTMDDETVEQIDGVVYAAHLACLVEAKDAGAAVDVAALAKIRTQLARRPAGTIGLVVSRTGFTGPAVTLAGYFAPQTVLLMAGAELEEALENESIAAVLVAKHRECIEEGVPKTLLFRRLSG